MILSERAVRDYSGERCYSPHRGQVQGRLALLVLHGGIGSVGQQQRTQLGPPLLRRLVERRERPLIGGVHARVVLDQQGGDVHVLDGESEIRNTRAAKPPPESERVNYRIIWTIGAIKVLQLSQKWTVLIIRGAWSSSWLCSLTLNPSYVVPNSKCFSRFLVKVQSSTAWWVGGASHRSQEPGGVIRTCFNRI